MTPLIDFDSGWDTFSKTAGRLLTTVNVHMHYLHRCCSVGTLHGVRASEVDDHGRIKDIYNKKLPMTFGSPPKDNLLKQTTIYGLMKEISSSEVCFVPEIFAHYYVLSHIWAKTKTGYDTSGDQAYGNYKCSQVLMFDRLTEDKDPKKGFRFTYNDIYAIDNFVEWLATQDNKYGEFYVTPAIPGAHKAKVRGGVLTPNLEALDAFETEHFPIVQAYLLAQNAFLLEQTKTVPAAVSATGKLW